MPQVIDIAEFTRQEEALTGEVGGDDLPRLKDLVAPSEQRLHYELRGALSAGREPRITCIIRGSISLQCQRCLGVFEHPLAIHSTLVFVADESLLPAIEDEDESTDYMVTETTLAVLGLVEDEVILALPMAPRHETGKCKESAGQPSNDGKPSPFAALAGLKRN